MNNHRLEKIVPIRWTAMTWIPLLIIAFFPGGLFFNFIKAILLLWVFITIGSIWKYVDYWTAKGYQTLQAFVTQNTILFAIILFTPIPSWVVGILIVWIMIGFQTKFSQIDEANKVIATLPTIDEDDIEILHQYLGQTSYLLDKKKLSLIKDEINLEQWQKNMNLIFSDISPRMFFLENSSVFLGEKENQLLNNATPELKIVLKGLSSVINYPLSLKRDTHAWFIAAYPDVLNFFYPSPDYGKKSFDEELKRVKKSNQVTDAIMDDFLSNIEKKYEGHKIEPNIDDFLLELKEYYKNELNKQFLLSNGDNIESAVPKEFVDKEKYCSNCGEKVNKSTNFCISCGASLKG